MSHFLGPSEWQKHACVAHTISLAKHRRCCSAGAHHPWNDQVVECFAMTLSLLGRQWRRWCEKQQCTAGSHGTCKKEDLWKKYLPKDFFYSCLLQESLPAWKPSFWCTGLEMFALGWDLQGLEHRILLNTTFSFMEWRKEIPVIAGDCWEFLLISVYKSYYERTWWHLPFLKYSIIKGQKNNSFSLDFTKGKYYKILYEEQRFPIIKRKKEENNFKIVSTRLGEKNKISSLLDVH